MKLVTLSELINQMPQRDAQPSHAPDFQLTEAIVHQGSTLTGQAKIDFELMLACAIFEQPKCQTCIAKSKRQSPNHC